MANAVQRLKRPASRDLAQAQVRDWEAGTSAYDATTCALPTVVQTQCDQSQVSQAQTVNP